MKKIILFLGVSAVALVANAQKFHAKKLISSLFMKNEKFDEWVADKRFYLKAAEKIGDTTVKQFVYKPEVRKKRVTDSVNRSMLKKDFGDYSILTYKTDSRQEVELIKSELTELGFYCLEAVEPREALPQVYQHNDETVLIWKTTTDNTTDYSLLFEVKAFPNPQDLFFADDLACFTSQEYLSWFFGQENIKEDIYYIGPNEINHCTVLFPNTARQIVYIWSDDVNKRNPIHLLFGGQQKLKSQQETGKFIAESSWIFKSGLKPGMTLYELRVLNEANLKFYAANAEKAGNVLVENGGKINFKRQNVILNCMNCNDGKFASKGVITADEALRDGRILFVQTVVLDASPESAALNARSTLAVTN